MDLDVIKFVKELGLPVALLVFLIYEIRRVTNLMVSTVAVPLTKRIVEHLGAQEKMTAEVHKAVEKMTTALDKMVVNMEQIRKAQEQFHADVGSKRP